MAVKMFCNFFFKFYQRIFCKNNPDLIPIRISKNQYHLICDNIDNYCIDIQKEIALFKNKDILVPRGKKLFIDYVLVSKYGDFYGPTVEKNGTFFKMIKADSSDQFISLWKTGIIQTLSKKGFLPECKITDFFAAGYPIVIQLQTLTFKKYTEVSLQDYAIGLFVTTIINKVLNSFGYRLYDAHYDNIVFVKSNLSMIPIYIDIGSIISKDIEESLLVNKYNISKLEANTDADFVFRGIHRLIFTKFPNSVLSKYELNNPIIGRNIKPHFMYAEQIYYIKKFINYHKYHSSSFIKQIAKKVLYEYEVTPDYFFTLFLMDYVTIEDIIIFLRKTYNGK